VPTGLVLLALAVSVFSLLAIDLLWHGPVTAAVPNQPVRSAADG